MRRDVLLLEEMIEAAGQAVELVEGVTVEDLAADRIRRDALLWNFAVLGEAAAQLSAELKQEFADVAWRQPARLRNRIVHGYWSIDLDVVHATAQEQLPGFTADLRRVLAALADRTTEAPADPLPPVTRTGRWLRHPSAALRPEASWMPRFARVASVDVLKGSGRVPANPP